MTNPKEQLKVFAIAHSCVVKEYRWRYSEYSKQGLSVQLLTPVHWNQFNKKIVAPVLSEDESISLIRKQPLTWGIPFHGLRNASHIYRGLKELIADFSPDIVEVWAEPFSAVTWQALRAFRDISPSGPFFFFSAQNIHKWRPFPYTWFEQKVFQESTGCLAMNEDVVKVLSSKGWRGPSRVFPLGLNPETYKAASPCDLSEIAKECTGKERISANVALEYPGFDGSIPIIAFIGKLDEQKGLRDLLTALEKISSSGNSLGFSFLAVGNGPLAGVMNDYCRSAGFPALHLHAIPHSQIPSLLRAVHIVVVPSKTMPGLKEQFGRIVVEAMAAARAVIVSDSGELPNVVRDCGMVFPEGDIPALVSLLRKLLSDSQLAATLGKKAAAFARERYSWEVIARGISAYYREHIS